nr:helix-turn-helix transcriptional regulator [Actinomycetospora corticicola]
MAEEFARALRRLRLASGMTQQAVADALSVRRPTFTQWESGRYLPSERNIAALDDLLRSDGELARVVDPQPSTVAATPEPTTPSAYEVFRRVGRTLVDEMARDDDGHPVGWRRDFGQRPASPLSTATGIRLLTIVDTPFVDLGRLGRSLAAMEDSSGGWGARGFRGRPEVTALVMDALARIGGPLDLDRLVPILDRQTTARSLGQVHVTSEVLRSLAPLRTDADLTKRAVHALLGTRLENGAWPEKRATRSGITPQSSPAHTARAVIALRTYCDCGGEEEATEVGSALDEATTWLAGQQDFYYPVRENLEPSPEDPEYGDLEIRHFTGALVAQALLRHRPTSRTAIDAAVDATWQHYWRAAGLWAWPNGDTPIWMQHEGVLAILLLLQRRHHAPPAEPAIPLR